MSMVQSGGWTVQINSASFIVSWVSKVCSPLDSVCGHFSFAVYSTAPEVFLAELELILQNSDCNDRFLVPDAVCLPSMYWSDTLRMERHGRSLTITRGNLKVLYHGDIGVFHSMLPVFKKAVAKYKQKYFTC